MNDSDKIKGNRTKEELRAEDFGFSENNPGAENTAALCRAIAAGETVSVTAPGIYDMAGTVRLPDDTHLRFASGVVLRRVPLEDRRLEGNLFINEGAFDGRFNHDISVSGAHIVVNGVESASFSPDCPNVIAGLRGHIAFLYIRNVLVEDVMITDLMSKDYAIQISDFENAEVRRVHLEGLKDGVHFGPGRHFAVRDSLFRTYDDAIALNASDYSVSNPNFGTISDGVIENCVELPGYETEAFFLRILVGTARKWEKGMTVYHSDAILTPQGMYRVVMRPDNTPYVSVTPPDFADGYKELDGIMWVRTHKAYAPEEIPLTAGCKNIVCRDISFAQARHRTVLIYTAFDEYLRSYYAGSELPDVSDILFDRMRILKPAERFLSINTKTENVHIINSRLSDDDITYEPNSQQNFVTE